MIVWLAFGCRGGAGTTVPYDLAVIVDDFRPVGLDGSDIGESRMDTERTWFGAYLLQDSLALMDALEAPAGATVGVGRPGIGLSSQHMLGPYIAERWQPTLTGVQFTLGRSDAELTLALFDPSGAAVFESTVQVAPSDTEVVFAIPAELGELTFHQLTWTVTEGTADVGNVLLLLDAPEYANVEQEAFLYSYAALSRCWDPEESFIQDRCDGRAERAYGADVTGLFALATMVANDLGYVDGSALQGLVIGAHKALLEDVPVDPNSGLFPERFRDGAPTEESYWSTLHTVIALQSIILASIPMNLSTTEFEAKLEAIDWDRLTTFGADPISAGVDTDGELLDWRLGVFGSKALLVQLAHAGAEGSVADMDNDGFIPTWDGSGYENELAALLFPTLAEDVWGNDWRAWRDGAFWNHHTWTRDAPAGGYNLFGLSASEVPEPWTMEPHLVYGEWGVGGQNQLPSDGAERVGYTIVAPHYAAMTAAEHPYEVPPMLTTLLDNHFLSPLNAVDSVGVDGTQTLRWNHHARAWSLALQTLGLGRALSGVDYLPYRYLEQNVWLRLAHDEVLPGGTL